MQRKITTKDAERMMKKMGGGGGGKGSGIFKLWENDSPTSGFAAQTITIDGDYDAIFINACYSSSYIRAANTVMVNLDADNINCLLSVMWQTNTSRLVNVTKTATGLSIEFLTGSYYGTYGGSATNGESYCVPLSIYGVKL